MSTTKDLFKTEAVEKLSQIAMDCKTCLFCTELFVIPIKSRPMTVTEIDDEGNLWFISSTESNKNFEISEDDRVQLFFTNNSKNEYLNVFGTAKVYTDSDTINEFWSPIAKVWFEEGKKDPKVSLIKVTPSNVHYWDSKNGKLITLLKIASAMATGNKADVGETGKLSFN